MLVVGEEVEGVHGNTMAPHAQTGVKRLEAKWLAARGGDHLMRINAVRVTRIAHLIHIRDIDHAVAVLE